MQNSRSISDAQLQQIDVYFRWLCPRQSASQAKDDNVASWCSQLKM